MRLKSWFLGLCLLLVVIAGCSDTEGRSRIGDSDTMWHFTDKFADDVDVATLPDDVVFVPDIIVTHDADVSGCRSNDDCEGDDQCIDGQCQGVQPCVSDRECTPLGMLCDRPSGECKECIVHSDCAADHYCASGSCVPDVCIPGESRCEGNARITCSLVGDGFGPPQPCDDDKVCEQRGREAVCADLPIICDRTCSSGDSSMCGGRTPHCLDGCCAPCTQDWQCGDDAQCTSSGTCEPRPDDCAGGSRIIVTDEAGIDFGTVNVHQRSARVVTIENCSRFEDLLVYNIMLSGDADAAFEIPAGSLPAEIPGGTPHRLAPHASVSFVLGYAPHTPGIDVGELLIRSADAYRPTLRIPLLGQAQALPCPIADARGRVVGSSSYATDITARPLQTIEFSSSRSSDPSGTDLSYEWSIVSRPTNSQARLAPDEFAPNPRLMLDLAGDYEVALTVYNAYEVASCTASKVTIHAVPDQDIHIQLVWRAPAVPNPAQGRGTDLDLHYLHPLGHWNEAPYAVFWRNRSANWGTVQNPSIATLDIDDLYGLGPENINHRDPVAGLSYAIGVYYYSDRGYGQTRATVRVYINGLLSKEFLERSLPSSGYFWYVGDIQWPSGNIVSRDLVRFGFP